MSTSASQWKDLSGLDRRISKALAKLGYVKPTEVQSQCIPLALLGKDILVKARTGSGKTVAFGVPLLQKVLALREADPEAKDYVKCLILVPTKELCKQDWRWRLPCIGVYQALTLLSLSFILCITSFALLSASQRLSHRADLPSHGTQPIQPRGRVVLQQAGIRITYGWIFQA